MWMQCFLEDIELTLLPQAWGTYNSCSTVDTALTWKSQVVQRVPSPIHCSFKSLCALHILTRWLTHSLTPWDPSEGAQFRTFLFAVTTNPHLRKWILEEHKNKSRSLCSSDHDFHSAPFSGSMCWPCWLRLQRGKAPVRSGCHVWWLNGGIRWMNRTEKRFSQSQLLWTDSPNRK